jgi:hypothetical protein
MHLRLTPADPSPVAAQADPSVDSTREPKRMRTGGSSTSSSSSSFLKPKRMRTSEVAEAAPPATAPHLPHRLPPPSSTTSTTFVAPPPPPLRHAPRTARLVHGEATIAAKAKPTGSRETGRSLPWMPTGQPPPRSSWRRRAGMKTRRRTCRRRRPYASAGAPARRP